MEKGQYKFFKDGRLIKLITNQMNAFDFVTAYVQNKIVIEEHYKYFGDGTYGVVETSQHPLKEKKDIVKRLKMAGILNHKYLIFRK